MRTTSPSVTRRRVASPMTTHVARRDADVTGIVTATGNGSVIGTTTAADGAPTAETGESGAVSTSTLNLAKKRGLRTLLSCSI